MNMYYDALRHLQPKTSPLHIGHACHKKTKNVCITVSEEVRVQNWHTLGMPITRKPRVFVLQ